MPKTLSRKRLDAAGGHEKGESLERALQKLEEHLRIEGYAIRTIRSYLFDLGHFLTWLVGKGISRVDELGMPLLSEYQSFLATEPGKSGKIRTVGTRAHILAAIVTFGRFLRQSEMVGRNPFEGLVLPRALRKLPENLVSVREMERLLAAPDLSSPVGLRDRAVMELLYATGLRQSELLNLSLGDVDLSSSEARVRRGKGGQGRIVPICRETVGVLAAYLAEARPVLAEKGDPGHFFLSSRGRRASARNLLDRFKQYARKAGVKRSVGFHTFRHSVATHLMQRRAGLRYIQELLGHESIATTQIYTHVSIADLKAVHARYHPRERMNV